MNYAALAYAQWPRPPGPGQKQLGQCSGSATFGIPTACKWSLQLLPCCMQADKCMELLSKCARSLQSDFRKGKKGKRRMILGILDVLSINRTALAWPVNSHVCTAAYNASVRDATPAVNPDNLETQVMELGRPLPAIVLIREILHAGMLYS